MELSIEKNAAISKNNTAMTGIFIMNAILAVAYLLEVVKQARTLPSYLIILALCVVPSILSIVFYFKKKETKVVRYILGVGFGLLYTYIMFTSNTDLTFCYVIVAFVILLVYTDVRLMLTLGIYAFIVNVALIIKKIATSTFTDVALTNAEIMLACIILTFVFAFMAVKKINKISQANIDTAKEQKNQSEELLEKVLNVANSITKNIENATVETSALRIAIEDTQREMDKLNCGTNDTLNAIVSQKESTDRIDMHIHGVETSVGSILTDVESAEKNLDEGSGIMANLLQQVKISEESNEMVAKEMKTLKECTDKMQDIIELISNVARQTSMLALNASIESARAGEAGRGFAVVASQISGLAAQTNEATTDINGLIANITESVTSVTEAMDKLLESSQLQNHYVEGTAESFDKIRESTQGIFKQTAQLKEMVDVVLEANEQVNESISNVSMLTGEISGSADETLALCNTNLESIAKVSEVMINLSENAKELKSE